jgi:hypothetical protein
MIALLTDFGVSSPYVAQMRGVIAQRSPAASVVDITHAIVPQQIAHAAVVLEDCVPWFPPYTIYLCVVDPGVGTSRRLIAGRLGVGFYLGPDNGLVSHAADRFGFNSVVVLDRQQFWLDHVSPTFHGRDILAPVASELDQGIALASLGTPADDWVRLPANKAERDGAFVLGEIVAIDAFGNAITNVFAESVKGRIESVTIGATSATRQVATYGEAHRGETVFLFGSSGRLEIAIVEGNAAHEHGLHVADRVRILM